MRVKFMGFRFVLKPQGPLSLETFAQALSARGYDPSAPADGQRLFFLNDSADTDYHVGVVITVKDHKTYCELVRAPTNILVRVAQVRRDASLMDFNFFVLHKRTGAGMYQYYHHSCSVSTFCHLAGTHFKQYKELAIAEKIAAAGGSELTEARRVKIRREHNARFSWEVLVRQEALQSMIEELEKVKSFEYVVATPEVPQAQFKAHTAYIKNRASKITFVAGTPGKMLAAAIQACVRAERPQRGRIEGVDAHGVEKVISILDNPENFGEYDYDQLASRLDQLDVTRFSTAWVVEELLRQCREHRHIFEMPMR
ncbi:hypothetical protein [Acidovorax sp. SUPP2825]|uniref:hypothetical protein n=1 Tax=Acidovorax sp. SUPP2825 TaxID=2920879 RepID=UPI0023DE651B|nr:hypothetical protein [Acidovorax sp. SUPP2825]GKS96709.1 hypothetical protein AVAK2825_19260 [Acidovorax sp. SUPP2825]